MTLKNGGYYSKLYYSRLRKGVCPRCGGNRDNGFLLCAKCREYCNKFDVKRKTKNNWANAKRTKQLYKRRGLCRCSRVIDDTRFTQCSICRDAAVKRYWANKSNILAQREKHRKEKCDKCTKVNNIYETHTALEGFKLVEDMCNKCPHDTSTNWQTKAEKVRE